MQKYYITRVNTIPKVNNGRVMTAEDIERIIVTVLSHRNDLELISIESEEK